MTRFHASRVVSLAVLAAAASLLAATATAAPAAAATSYTVTDMGSLGGGQSIPSAINATGQATGNSSLSTTYTISCGGYPPGRARSTPGTRSCTPTAR